MPYSITTQDGITIANIPDDVAPDAPELKSRVAEIRAGQPVAGAQPAEPEERGLLAGIAEAVTGRERATQQTQELPDWAAMPELNTFSMASFKSALGTIMTAPEETVQVIKANFPNVGIRQDEKGNFLLRSSIDGQEYAIKPGIQVSDIPRAAGALAAFTPAGRAVTIPGAAVGAAGTQAAIEASQLATGGEFNVPEIATSGLVGALVPAAGKLIQAAKPTVTRAVQRITGRTPKIQPTAPPTGIPPVSPTPAPGAAPAVAPAAETDITGIARKAAEGGIGAKSATRILAEEAAPDPKVIESARRLGIEEYLQPDHLTANQAYRELAQAVKSFPGSQTRAAEMQGLTQVGQRADRLITEIGGTTDLSKLNVSVRGQLGGMVKELEDKADDAYKSLRTNVPAQTRGPAENVLGFVEQRVQDLGGDPNNLSKLERMIRSKLTPKKDGQLPTYALIDDVRRDIGAAARQAGPFSDADTGLAKKLYSLIDDDQFALAETAGQGENYRLAKSLVKMRKGYEDDMTALFGKQIDQSLVGKLESATMALSKGDTEKIAKIITAVPPEMRQMVTASALNTAFGKATQNGTLNFNTYAKWYDGLLANKQAYAALMTNLPQPARKQLSDLYRVSSNVAKASRERIQTGRLQVMQKKLEDADTLLANIYGVAKRAAIGAPIEAATSAVGFPGAGIGAGIAAALMKSKPSTMKAADELISSPQFQRLTIEAATKPQPSAETVRRLAYSKSFRNFAEASKLPRSLPERERWIMNIILSSKQYNQ